MQEVAESNMSGIKADTESECTCVNTDMSDSSFVRPHFWKTIQNCLSFYSIIIMIETEYHTVLLFSHRSFV